MTELRELLTNTSLKAAGVGLVVAYLLGVAATGTPTADTGPIEQVERDITDAPSR